MDKETKALIDFYDNKIKDLENENKEKQDKLDKIENHCNTQKSIIKRQPSDDKSIDAYFIARLNTILYVIKGEDK